MNIIDFTHNHIEQATAIAKANYEEERKFVTLLPTVEVLPDLVEFADNGLGVTAFENGEVLGFLCCYTPWDNAFTTYAKGTFSPIHAHGAIMGNRETIYKGLYQAAAEKWVKLGITSHAVGLYAHDSQVVNSFFVNGFGLRCVDAIRSMTAIECLPISGYDFFELDADKKSKILPLKNSLIDHLGKSPTFMSFPQMTYKDFDKYERRIFAALKGEVMISFIEVSDNGENFACDDSSMKNICGAFCLPEYRGIGVFQNLLNYTIATLESEGHTRLGVDFESFNPAAYGFWLKYFTVYTNGVVRRIDEQILT